MKSYFSKLDTYYFKTLDELTAEVQAGCRRGYCCFILGIYGLITLTVQVLRLALDVLRKWRLAQLLEHCLKGIIVAIKQEADGTSAACGVVNYLCYQLLVVAEVKL